VTAFAPGTTSPSTAEVTKIRSPQTIGEEYPAGSAVFHAMFFPGPHSVGSCCSIEIPWLPGPRHCGQFSADTVAAAAVSTIPAKVKRMKRVIRMKLLKGVGLAIICGLPGHQGCVGTNVVMSSRLASRSSCADREARLRQGYGRAGSF
jgi:hypothetical protein